MRKWYGQTCVIKTDIASAFDNVSWQSLIDTLEKRGLPPYFINMLLQSQMAGYILEWHGVYDQIVWVPTTGVRQG
eukprot:3357173-Amphidinium_carterae.1